MKIHHRLNDYAERRQPEYPDIGDQLDAVFKLVQHMKEQGRRLPPETEQWVDKCQQVKNKYPAA